jgi:hypothetical protein
MTVFEYVAVIVSIVLALGMTQVLAGFAHVLRNRARVALHWPQFAWSIWLFMFHVQIWWGYWNARSLESLGYFPFLLHLLWPVTLFLLSTLVWPDFNDGAVNLSEYFHRNRRPFFGILIASNVIGVSADTLMGRPPTSQTMLVLVPWVALYAVAFATRNERVHNGLAGLALVGMVHWVITFNPIVSGAP